MGTCAVWYDRGYVVYEDGVDQVSDFLQLGVSQRLVDRLKANGIANPTPVQAETIPIVYQNKDVISQAQTGTGKTLAFVLPMLDKIRPELPQVQGLILTPTRELALQITAEVKKLLDPSGDIKVLAVYGGQDVEAQLHKLKGHNHIVVATPGRLLDHLRRETISLADIKMLVLDEADQMLHMGFMTEVETILRQTPYKKQVMLFSATMPPRIRELAEQILRSPVSVTVKAERVTVKDIRQWAVETTDRGKQNALVQLLEKTQPYLAIIFCRTKRRASTLNEALQAMGYDSDELHGDLSQMKREQVMKRFRDAKLQLLVATDVAARGLDVEGVTHVFNYDVPQDVESYIHRIGRTGRAGEKGLAITLYVGKDKHEMADIEDGIQMTLERRTEEGASLSGGALETTRVGGGYGRGPGGAAKPRGGAAGSRGGAGGGGRSGAGGGRGAAGGRNAGGERGRSGGGRGGFGGGEAGAGRGRAAGGRSGPGAARGGRDEGRGAGFGEAGRGRGGSKPAGKPARGGGDPSWSVASPAGPRGGARDARGSASQDAGRGAGGGRGASGASIKQRAAEGRKQAHSDERVGFGRESGRGGPKGGGFRGGPGGPGGGNRGAGGRPANKRAPRGR